MNPLKYISLTAVVGLSLAVSAGAQGVLTLNFASTPGSTIQFNGSGSSFQFNSSSSGIFNGVFIGSQWQIGSQNGGTGFAALGLLGLFNNNTPFSYGSITSVTNLTGVDQYANVTGPTGALQIRDGSGFNLTGNINWAQVSTHNYSGAALTVNITGLSYSGSNPDLLTFAANGPGSMNLTFQFSPGMTLADLTSGSGPYTTSYSGSLSVVPEPTSIACLVLGLGVLTVARRVKKSKTFNAT